ncbi:hypothetical protein FGO68_gene12064 [Halteria grandinella]|uniref:Uncharacterized protein n=1 Tax=Halteria grandinella TaxID=5974 RepID=A0A8J8NUE1_HALGN|nr:hypothetical protein FGO68_gene12064 [Halteria grandinella]
MMKTKMTRCEKCPILWKQFRKCRKVDTLLFLLIISMSNCLIKLLSIILVLIVVNKKRLFQIQCQSERYYNLAHLILQYQISTDAQQKTARPRLAVLPPQHTSSTAYLRQHPSRKSSRSYSDLLEQ